MIKVVAVVAHGAIGRGFCRLLEMDGDIEVVSAAESLSTVDVHACRHNKLIVVVGPNIPFGGKPDTWDGLDVILVSPNPKPDRLPGVTEVPMELTGSAMRSVIRHLATESLDAWPDATTNGDSVTATVAEERTPPIRKGDLDASRTPPCAGSRPGRPR